MTLLPAQAAPQMLAAGIGCAPSQRLRLASTPCGKVIQPRYLSNLDNSQNTTMEHTAEQATVVSRRGSVARSEPDAQKRKANVYDAVQGKSHKNFVIEDSF
jgi:hypothetical protein